MRMLGYSIRESIFIALDYAGEEVSSLFSQAEKGDSLLRTVLKWGGNGCTRRSSRQLALDLCTGLRFLHSNMIVGCACPNRTFARF